MPGEQGPSDLGVSFSFSPVLAVTCGRATGPHSRPGPVPTPPLQWAQPGSDRGPAEGKGEATCAPRWRGCRRQLTSDPVFHPHPPSCPGFIEQLDGDITEHPARGSRELGEERRSATQAPSGLPLPS